MGLRWGAPAGSSRGPAWAVVLELAVPDGRGTLDFSTVEALVEYLADWGPSALYDPHRYAIQVQLSAPDAESALASAIQGHGKAALALGISFLSLVRAEVLTAEELASGQAGSGVGEMFAGSGSPVGLGHSKPSDALYQATRALLAVTRAEELRGVMANFVVDLGGRLAAGDVEVDPSTTPVAHEAPHLLLRCTLFADQGASRTVADINIGTLRNTACQGRRQHQGPELATKSTWNGGLPGRRTGAVLVRSSVRLPTGLPSLWAACSFIRTALQGHVAARPSPLSIYVGSSPITPCRAASCNVPDRLIRDTMRRRP